ncbi:histidine kinase [Streptomyces sp. WAC06614]|uniref:sensor histidine kinase n=1 Tax=Streptomyces sp. WAC06614 TaxID=2487416 RepID=UPI000F7B12D7|nr:histidine kinase [Streptomyces sp. WAC06614]RSS61692.1 two-component sensor histidine kinase [Streptomyces sp. WAC06614]
MAGHLGDLPRPYVQLAALAAGVALFPLRRRFPAPVLLTLAVLTGPAPCVGPVTAATAYAVARRTARARTRARLLVAAGGLLVLCATVAAPWTGPGEALYGLGLGLVLVPAVVLVPGLAGTAYGQQGRLLQALRERGDAAEQARRLAESEARTHERSRIAAEMHDLVGHRLSLISLHAGGLELALDRAAPELREEAVLVRRTTRDAMRELRQALGVLGPLGRDTGPDALTDATGTRADVEALVDGSRAGGIAVRLDWTGPDLDTCPAGVRRAVHRVVREGLTNVHRYAVAAHVVVAVRHDDGGGVRVCVRNGAPPPGSAPAATGLGTGRGLAGLRERTALLGGTLTAGPLPAGGFDLTATLPTTPGTTDPPARGGAGPGASAAPDTAAGTGATRGAAPGTPAEPDTAARAGVPGPHAGRATGADTAAATAADTDAAPGAAETPGAPGAGRRTVEALTLASGLVGLCVLMVIGITFVHAYRPHPPSGPAPLPRIGMTYAEVAQDGILDNAAVRAAATGHEPARPAGAVGCIYPFNGATERHGPGALTIARYCFDAGHRLLSIDRFTVPSVRDTTPWENP